MRGVNWLAGLVLVMALSGCGGATWPEQITSPETPIGVDEGSHAEEWVVVFEDAEERMPAELLDALLPTEIAAAEALESSGLGYIDGNDIGACWARRESSRLSGTDRAVERPLGIDCRRGPIPMLVSTNRRLCYARSEVGGSQ